MLERMLLGRPMCVMWNVHEGITCEKHLKGPLPVQFITELAHFCVLLLG